MRIKYIDDIITIYLKNIFEKDLKKLAYDVCYKIKNYYNIELKGFYKVNIYIDKNYGTILEYIDEGKDLYFNFSKLELNIEKYEEKFLYEIEDIFYPSVNKFILYNNKYYIDKYIEKMEISKIIYKDMQMIEKNGNLKILK